jgi:hypothetical protein
MPWASPRRRRNFGGFLEATVSSEKDMGKDQPGERAGVREPEYPAMACMGRFLESSLFKNDLLTDQDPGDSGGRDALLYGRRDARRYGRRVHDWVRA